MMKHSLRASAFAASLIVLALIVSVPRYAAVAQGTSSISGQIVDAKTHQPIGGVKVAMYADVARHGSRMLAATISSKDGGFRLEGVTGGQYRLELTKMGYEVQILSGLSVRAQEHTIVGMPISMHAASQRYMATMACNQVVRPDEVADVYVVCSGK